MKVLSHIEFIFFYLPSTTPHIHLCLYFSIFNVHTFFLQFSFYCIWRIHLNVLIIYYIDKLKHGKTSRKGWKGMIINTWTICCSTLYMILIQIHACIFSHITHIEWFIILIVSNTCNKFSSFTSTFFSIEQIKNKFVRNSMSFYFLFSTCMCLFDIGWNETSKRIKKKNSFW